METTLAYTGTHESSPDSLVACDFEFIVATFNRDNKDDSEDTYGVRSESPFSPAASAALRDNSVPTCQYFADGTPLPYESTE